MQFEDLAGRPFLYLYAGDLPDKPQYRNTPAVGLSLTQDNERHIRHDVSTVHRVLSNTVDMYQAEDVFEHIEYSAIHGVLVDIYRMLKKGGLFRLSLPDYRCDCLYTRSLYDYNGNIVFDPGGGGEYSCTGQVTGLGHVWFPKYETMKQLLTPVPFSSIEFLHWYDETGKPHCESIDYTKGFIQRTPDHDPRVRNPYRPMSMVIDCIK